jgi:hypothetical protein
MPQPWLADFVLATGREATAELLAPEPLARLETYLLTRVVARLGLAAMPPFRGPGGQTRVLAQELAAIHAADVLAPGWIRARIEGALAGTAPMQAGFRTPPPRRLVRRRALERARSLPLPERHELTLLAAALALVQRPRLASQLLDVVRPIEGSLSWEPLGDRIEWRQKLLARVASDQGDRLACGLLWLLLEALDGLDGQVDDALLRGVQTMVELVLEQPGRVGSRAVLTDSVIWLGSCCGLAVDPGEERRQGALADVGEALDMLDPVPNESGGLPAVGAWPPQGWAPGSEDAGRLPLVLRSLRACPELGHSASRIWAVLS